MYADPEAVIAWAGMRRSGRVPAGQWLDLDPDVPDTPPFKYCSVPQQYTMPSKGPLHTYYIP